MVEQPDADVTQVTPEQFAELVGQATDEEIAQVVRAVGVDATLDRIFQGFEERFRPEKAQGVSAVVQFVITDDGSEHAHRVSIDNGTCSAEPGRTDNAKTTLTTDVVSFCKLIAGKEDGTQLFMAGKLRVGGDLMFATRIMTFFDRPGA